MRLNGEVLWQRHLGGTKQDIIYTAVEKKEGGFILAGRTSSKGAGGFDYWIISMDKRGRLLWKRTAGGGKDDSARALIQQKDGGFVIAGTTASFGSGGRDIWLVKVNKDGEIVLGGKL